MIFENDDAIDAVIKNLERIPTDIDTEILVEDIKDAIMRDLRRKIAI